MGRGAGEILIFCLFEKLKRSSETAPVRFQTTFLMDACPYSEFKQGFSMPSFPCVQESIFELQQFLFKQRFLELADEFLPVRKGRQQVSYQKKMIGPISA